MNEAISHADNLWPWDFTIVGTIFRGDSTCCLTNDFQQADQSQVEEAVCVEVRPRLVVNEAVCLACMIQHMTQGNAGLMLGHRVPLPLPALRHGNRDSNTWVYSCQPYVHPGVRRALIPCPTAESDLARDWA